MQTLLVYPGHARIENLMAVKRERKPCTPSERAAQDRAMRARKSYPKFDRYSCYMQSVAELASELGADVVGMYEEWLSRCESLLFTGDHDVEDCEQLALEHVRDAYRRAS